LAETLKKAADKDPLSPEEVSHLEDILISLKEVRRLYGSQKQEIILITGSSTSRLKEIISETQTSLAGLKEDIAKNKSTNKQAPTAEKTIDTQTTVSPEQVTPTDKDLAKGEKYKEAAYSNFKLSPQQEDENNAVCEALGIKDIKFKEIDLSSLAAVLGQMGDFSSFSTKLATLKDWQERRDFWKTSGYDFRTGFFKGSHDTVIELDAFAAELTKDPSKLQKVGALSNFYRNGKTAVDFLRRSGQLTTLNQDIGKDIQDKKSVFAFLSDSRGDGTAGNDPEKVDAQISEGQIHAILVNQYRQNPQGCLANVAKIMELGGLPGQGASFKNLDELLTALQKNPGLQVAFTRGVNLLKDGFVGFMSTGNLDTYYQRKADKCEALGVELENALKGKVDEAFARARQKAAGNQAVLTALDHMETEKQNIVWGYKTTLFNILGSSVEGKSGIGASFSQEIAKNLSLDI